ncbi:GMC family oxidoreductase [Bradyrhizobium neotropicale]|uniref:GMC family oxidoreductase n=1 Tax=Bradyrhizobium neotropicale TaxID=1497615 RepID=UPI001AD622FD|nr:GMC family oxidoreductase N-terminal domain-containing protein [Bradyrhizobium neotropicale]MBO4225746.1 GMC family oxidoreductase [Bradyrhizobium neotropicale]
MNVDSAKFEDVVAANQQRLRANLQPRYDFIVCGSGSSGSVVARRMAENQDVSVLLIEAGGTDSTQAVEMAGAWPLNLGSERDWGFKALPNPHLNGRAIPMSMGKVLGGGSSINVMIWARGHKSDWDYFATEADDPAWSYKSVLGIYREIEDWRGKPDPARRGKDGLLYVAPPADPNPVATAMLSSAAEHGIPVFDDQNGVMMEGPGGASYMDLRIRDGRRQSIFRSYTFPLMDRLNLTVLTGTLVARVLIERGAAVGVECLLDGRSQRFHASQEVILSLGAINTPKVLMQSGIGDADTLASLDIPVVQNLPGVGANFQDHIMVSSCVWEYPEPVAPHGNGGEVTVFTRSAPEMESPDIQLLQVQFPVVTPELAARHTVPVGSWGMFPALLRPRSVGRLRLTGANHDDPILIDSQILSDSADLIALRRCVELAREIGNASALRRFVKREIMPTALAGPAMDDFIRDGVTTVWHQSCTAKMGRDRMAVVDARLRVYGVDRLRIADASVMPRVPLGNTMAPSVIIGELASRAIAGERQLTSPSVAPL